MKSQESAHIGIIGECMIELVHLQQNQLQQKFGGDTLNMAVYLKRVAGDEVGVHYVTLLGDDQISDVMIESWQAEGILTECVERLPGELPGLYMIQTSAEGERSFLYWRDRAPAKQLFVTPNTPSLCGRLMQFDWLYVSGITLGIMGIAGRERLFEFFSEYRQQGGKVIFDINHRPRLWHENDHQYWYQRMYQCTDLAMPSLEDEELVWDDRDAESIINRIHQFGCPKVVLKQGTNDSLISSNGELQRYPVRSAAKVVDTTSAGDSFNGGYLAMALRGYSDADCIDKAQFVAGQVVGKKGAIVKIDT